MRACWRSRPRCGPEQCTLVPDAPDAFTSEEGFKLGPEQMALVRPAIATLKSIGARVILFIDPDPAVLDRIPASGADGVEIYTGSYAAAFRDGRIRRMPRRLREALRAPRRISGWWSMPGTT